MVYHCLDNKNQIKIPWIKLTGDRQRDLFDIEKEHKTNIQKFKGIFPKQPAKIGKTIETWVEDLNKKVT